MELYLTRHGQTVANVTRTIQGWQHGELTELGIAQADLLGGRLADTQFDAVYSSDLQRCIDTTAHILNQNNHQNQSPTPIYDARLREKGGGVLEGQPLGTTEKLAKKAGVSTREYRAENGESWTDVMQRGKSFLNETVPQYVEGPGAKVLVVAHGGFIMEFLNNILEMGGKPPVHANVSKNTSLYIIRFTIKSGKMNTRIVLSNDTQHLDDPTTNPNGPSARK